MRRFITILIVSVAAWPVVGAAAPRPSRSIEDSLFDDAKPGHRRLMDPRRIKLEDEVGRQGKVDRQPGWARELGAAALPEETLPLLSVAERMRDVEGMLRRADCGPTTQHAQRQIVESLDRLLEQVAKQCQGGSAAAGEKGEGRADSREGASDKPSDERSKEGGKEGKGADSGQEGATRGEQPSASEAKEAELGRMRVMMKELWGELPPRQREQMLQLPVEEFLPGYELLIEEYFRRLSEEKGRSAGGGGY